MQGGKVGGELLRRSIRDGTVGGEGGVEGSSATGWRGKKHGEIGLRGLNQRVMSALGEGRGNERRE